MELAQIQVAAVAARMTVTGFCARAALSVARREPVRATSAGHTPDGVQDLAELQAELFAARTAVNRTGTNLNQAVVALNSSGVAPVWLEHAVERVSRAVAELDAVAVRIHRRLA